MDDFAPLSAGTVDDEFEPAAGISLSRGEHHLAPLYRDLLRGVGEDVNREGLVGTPQRAAKAFEFLTKCLREATEVHFRQTQVVLVSCV